MYQLLHLLTKDKKPEILNINKPIDEHINGLWASEDEMNLLTAVTRKG